MCYNIVYLEKRAQEYHDRYKDILPETFKMDDAVELPMYYHVSGFVHPTLPIVKHDGIFAYQWGLIPPWCKDIGQAKDMAKLTLNAVGETVFEKPSFRNAIKQQRCLLGVEGFFESRDFNKAKYPYVVKSKVDEIFSLGCIYEEWADRTTGEVHHTFSIVTTPANPLMEKIHNLKKRMPLIIPRELEGEWIKPELTKEQIKELIKPYDENKMEAYTVSKMVNNAKIYRNIPEALERVEYGELD